MRLFVGVWPPAPVVAALGALPRPALDGVRWTGADTWHVTLHFLGEVAEAAVPRLLSDLSGAVAGQPPAAAILGPATTLLDPGVLVAPVDGLAPLAAAVITTSAGHAAAPPPSRPFLGHVTLARGRGRRPMPPELAGHAVEARWTARDLAVVRSHLGPAGATYEDVAVLPLGA